MEKTVQFEVRNRFTGAVQFTAEIECAEDTLPRIKLGLAVRWAYDNGAVLRGAVLRGAVLRGAVLRGADLRDADLSGAVLRGADLRDAVLRGADLRDAVLRGAVLRGAVLSGADLRGSVLRGAVLSGADLRQFKADFWMTLTQNPDEVPALLEALREGRVNGSQYEGQCACLVGTIANARHVPFHTLDHDANNPAEQWFMAIREGDAPGGETEGSWRAAKAIEWAEEWLALRGVSSSPRAASALGDNG